MKYKARNQPPPDATRRRKIEPVICYPIDNLPRIDPENFSAARSSLKLVDEIIVPPRDAATFHVPQAHFFRIVCHDTPQVGDLNLWNASNLKEHFYSGKTRALHGTHVSTGDRLWSTLPYLRPLATVTEDTLDWYGWDEFGGSVHDVIGTRCDPYTNRLLNDDDYHHCCHSNLSRALAKDLDLDIKDAEKHIHDVLNVFMCTGFTRDTKQYFMKASPVRSGDYLELFAEIELIGALSTCPGGDCGSKHSSEEAKCGSLIVQVYKPAEGTLDHWQAPKISHYSGAHGAMA